MKGRRARDRHCLAIAGALIWLAPFADSIAAECAALAKLELGGIRIDEAAVVQRGEFRTTAGFGADALNARLSELGAFCRVVATAMPVPDSEIGIEVWMPLEGWNGKYIGVGNGAWAGSISYAAMAGALERGFASASTDTGHIGNNADFAIGHHEKVVDFGHRAVHEMTVVAKSLIRALYESPAARSYFEGCSTGGRQALAEAQRYPEDYDGIIAGAPANYVTHLQGYQIWTANVGQSTPDAAIREEQLPFINDAVIAACDGIDGVEDGVIENPLHCSFDARSLTCGKVQSNQCLSPAQADTVNQKWRGPTDAHGVSLYPGSARGSERVWNSWLGPEPLGLADDVYSRLVFEDPEWAHESFDFSRDVPLALDRIGSIMNSNEPDLTAFFSRGGKLLLYHGWNDAGVPPEYTINYYQSVLSTVGADRAEDAIRLFLVPGMNHCRGGVGTDEFDRLGALDDWVVSDRAPESMLASKVRDDVVERTRPLCAFPKEAVYTGSGPTDEASSFSCGYRQ